MWPIFFMSRATSTSRPRLYDEQNGLNKQTKTKNWIILQLLLSWRSNENFISSVDRLASCRMTCGARRLRKATSLIGRQSAAERPPVAIPGRKQRRWRPGVAVALLQAARTCALELLKKCSLMDDELLCQFLLCNYLCLFVEPSVSSAIFFHEHVPVSSCLTVLNLLVPLLSFLYFLCLFVFSALLSCLCFVSDISS